MSLLMLLWMVPWLSTACSACVWPTGWPSSTGKSFFFVSALPIICDTLLQPCRSQLFDIILLFQNNLRYYWWLGVAQFSWAQNRYSKYCLKVLASCMARDTWLQNCFVLTVHKMCDRWDTWNGLSIFLILPWLSSLNWAWSCWGTWIYFGFDG